jgi:hypothetical protein
VDSANLAIGVFTLAINKITVSFVFFTTYAVIRSAL